MLALPEAGPFSAPVTDDVAPGYSAVVARPMDLGTLREGLERREYAHPADAYADVRQVYPRQRETIYLLHFLYNRSQPFTDPKP